MDALFSTAMAVGCWGGGHVRHFVPQSLVGILLNGFVSRPSSLLSVYERQEQFNTTILMSSHLNMTDKVLPNYVGRHNRVIINFSHKEHPYRAHI